MTRLGCVAALAALFVIDAPQTSNAQGNEDAFLGRWKSPGGNVISVILENGKPIGRLAQVSDEAKAVGFAEDEDVLKEISVTGTTVRMKVSVRLDIPKHPCPPY